MVFLRTAWWATESCVEIEPCMLLFARNAVQRECIKCKKSFYDRKVAKLKHTNIKRWWDEVKGLGGVRCAESWVLQMLSDQLPSVEALANRFNEFLGSLTAKFTPLPSQPCFSF